jgi:predicted transposase YdaD
MKGDDAIGKLMHDFGCKESANIYYQELAKGVKHFKEEEGGRKRMCEAVKEYAQEAVEAKAESMAIKMLKAGKYAIEEIADLTELSISQIQMLQKNI